MHAVRRSGGMHKNTLYKGRSTLVAMVTTAACSRPRASFSHKNVPKKSEIFISLSRYSFGHFCCRVKQGKRLSEFLQKCTDSGTETTHLAGYNILVIKYVKISAGLPLLFMGEIRERSSKSDIA